MEEIKQINLKQKEINIQYKNELITIKSEPFKTLESILMKALKKMLIIPKKELHCFYLGVDITKSIDKKIGDLFSHCEKVNIKLDSKEKDYINCYKNFSSSSIHKNNYTKLKLTNLTTIYPYEIKKNKSLINKSKKNCNSENKGKIEFSGENKKKLLNLLNNQKSLPLINNLINNKKKCNNNFLCNCKKYRIYNYCKNCQILLCNECKNNEKHKNHTMLQLNGFNYFKDIIDYGNNIQKDIINNINIHKTMLDKINIFSFTFLSKYKVDIIEKYKKMINKYFSLISQINKCLNKKETEERKYYEIENYNKLLNNIDNEIKDLRENAKNKNIDFNYLETIFNEISRKEEMLIIFNKKILKYYIINEINTKMNSTMKIIEKMIDELICSDNCFNLDSKYHDELIKMKIIETKIKNKDKQERPSIIIGGHEVSKNLLSKRRNNVLVMYNNE